MLLDLFGGPLFELANLVWVGLLEFFEVSQEDHNDLDFHLIVVQVLLNLFLIDLEGFSSKAYKRGFELLQLVFELWFGKELKNKGIFYVPKIDGIWYFFIRELFWIFIEKTLNV